MNNNSTKARTQPSRRRGRPRTSLRPESVVRWSVQDRNRLWHLKNRPEYKGFSWDQFQRLDLFPGRSSLALSMAYNRVEKKVGRGGSVLSDNPFKRPSCAPTGSSDARPIKKPKLEDDDEEEESSVEEEESSGEEEDSDDEDGSEYEITSTEVETQEASTSAQPGAQNQTFTDQPSRSDKRHSWHAAPPQTRSTSQPPQARGTTAPSIPNTTHISFSQAIAHNTDAYHYNKALSFPVAPAPTVPAEQLPGRSDQSEPIPPETLPHQPSLPGSTALPDQFFTHAVQNLIQCAHAIAQHKTYLSEMKMQQEAENALRKQEIEAIQQRSDQLTERERRCGEVEKRVEKMEKKVEELSALKKLAEDVRSLQQVGNLMEETLSKVDGVLSSYNQRDASFDEISKKLEQMAERMRVLDGLENLSALDMLRGWLGPNKK